MNARRLWLASALVLAPALVGLAAEKDVYGDPLPEGAKARMGTARLRNFNYSNPLMTPDGKSLLTVTNAGLMRLDPATGATTGKINSPFFGTPTLLSTDGKRAVNVQYDRVVVWDIGSSKEIAKIQRRTYSNEYSASLSQDGKTIAIGGVGDRMKKVPVTVVVWDVEAKKELKSITVPQNESANVVISGDGKTLATWGYHSNPDAKAPLEQDTDLNRIVHFWDATTGKQLGKTRVSGYSPSSVAFNPNGSIAAVASGDGSVSLIEPATGTEKHLLLGRTRMGRMVTFSPDGSIVVATGEDGAVQRWRVSDGTRLSTTEPPAPSIYSTRVRVLDNDRAIAWGMRGVATLVWEVPSGKLISTAGGHTGGVRAVAVTSDNKHVITSSDDGTTVRWELGTGKRVDAVPFRVSGEYFGSPTVSAFSSDGKTALVRDSIGGLGVHDMSNGSQLYTIPTPSNTTAMGNFSPDGTKVVQVCSSYDFKKVPARVTVWNVATSKRLGNIELPGYSQVAAAVTPDGKYVVTAGTKPSEKGDANEFVITGWELATGAKKGSLSEPSGFNNPYVAAAGDNQTAAVVTSKGQLIGFNITTGAKTKTYDVGRRNPGAVPVFSPDGKNVAVVCQSDYGPAPSAPVLVLEWATGTTKHTFASPGMTPISSAFSPDGKWLVTGSPDTTATVWSLSK
ncbi:MAG: hypothetical protein L0241_22045 [Planctomycetia bacterium]|nr:hypothetical protein [Planctomycetia bacterium]